MANPVETPRRRLTHAIVPALAAAALAGLGAMYLATRQPPSRGATAPAGCILDQADAIGGPIELVGPRGQTFTQADFASQPALVYFGFTHCPDVCPTTMYALTEALALPEGYDVQPILITVDPERDTPEVMAAYAATQGFPEGLLGLSGTPAQVQAAMRAFQVAASRGDATADGGYNVNHTTFMYVLDGGWRTVSAMPTFRPGELQAGGRMGPMAPVSPTEMQACIVAGLDRAAASHAPR